MSRVSVDKLQELKRDGIGTPIDLPGINWSLIMVDNVVFREDTGSALIFRDPRMGWVGQFPSEWHDKLEEIYRATQ
jgi:hypothetical protein